MSVDLEAIKARADKATPGPWEIGDGWVYTSPVYSDDQRLSSVLGMKYCADDRIAAEKQRAQRNAEFIAHAREDIPALLAEVRRLSGLLQSTYDALIQGGQTYYIRWKDAMTVLEGRKPGGVS